MPAAGLEIAMPVFGGDDGVLYREEEEKWRLAGRRMVNDSHDLGAAGNFKGGYLLEGNKSGKEFG